MADTTKPEALQPATSPAADIALDDWCSGKSRTLGRRVEGLAAFWKESQANGLGRATPAEFEAAFDAFMARKA